MSQDGGNTLPRITKAEHIGPDDTGDNIEAKRVASYEWDGSNWQRKQTTVTTSINTGRKTVTTAGTAVVLASSTTCKWVAITAETDNTSIVVVGDSGVIAALATREGTPLSAGDTIVIPIDNLADVYIDSLVNGEGVTFLYGV